MAISASFSFIKPNSPICLPKAFRSFVYLDEFMSTCFEPPTQEAPSVKDVESHDVAAADLVQQVFFGDFAVFQEDGGRRAAMNAHFVLFIAGLAAGESALHNEGGEFLSIDLGEDHVEVGKATVGDPHFLAVQDVVGALLVQLGACQ